MRAPKVYIAAPYSMKDQIAEYANELAQLGIAVTSSWINEPHKPTVQMADLTHEEHQKYAARDILDVLSADAMVFFTDPTKTIVRAGRHVEFGMAVMIGEIARPYPIFVVGKDYENIFHHLSQVTHYDSWDAVKEDLAILAKVSSVAF